MTEQKKIPFFNYPALFAEQESKYMEIIQGVLKRGYYIMGPELAEFEACLAQYLGVKHAIGMADGTMALLASCISIGLEPGDEVLVPSHTFVATAAAIHHSGATPIFVDCGRDHLIDAASVEAAVTDKTKAILPVQLNGRTANMDPIMALAGKYNLAIIEDSCQALGSKFKGQFAGTFGKAGSFSFYPSKTLGCFGDGGALITNDDDVAEKVKIFRDHGRGSDGKVHMYGFNSRLDNVQAAILLHKLKDYDHSIAKRRRLAAIYNERLRDLDSLLLPPAPDADPNHFDVFQNYEIEAQDRDALREHLAKNNIGTIVQWGGYVIHQFEGLNPRGSAPYADKMTESYMMLPMHTALLEDDVHHICDIIREFYQA